MIQKLKRPSLKVLLITIMYSLWATSPVFAAGQTIPKVLVNVSISQQKMTVQIQGRHDIVWPVSTARPGKITPVGSWEPKWLSKNHKSSLYNNAPMPYSIFFSGHYAIHGTTQIDKIGSPASAGCVRLHPDNAAILFHITQQVGLSNVKIEIMH